ncbi:hypothetical protein KIN20_027929 [Parelaphostrongylus tenuis]|uniref:Uncharacterized protein n=1 Tax=Parelaphostrongylus tenuis TaxID=148309 RepID=A0AAD5R002_PARTN|nr:hypothetical protein KIN20_027929 [Parelaphostrongylus tenuis]
MCEIGKADMEIDPIPASHTTISGAITATNVIMANWSRQMWQNVVNRAIRMLASAPFGLHFFTATVTLT